MVTRQIKIHNNLMEMTENWLVDDFRNVVFKLNTKGNSKKKREKYNHEMNNLRARVFQRFMADHDLGDELTEAINKNKKMFDEIIFEKEVKKK